MAAEAEKAPPCALVIFGGTGDLSKRLLLPALINLRRAALLPDQFAVLVVGRREQSSDALREDLTASLRELSSVDTSSDGWRWLCERLDYVGGSLESSDTWARLGSTLDQLADRRGIGGNVLFYLATPPDAFAQIVESLGESGLTAAAGSGWRRVVIEKPFGRDLQSAIELNRTVLSVLDERQVFRIDHFLGKEAVQNILALRFSNGIFEPLWNRNHVDHVQISATEELGVGQRGSFYDRTGALRDMVPNHLFQLLALAAMEAPTSFDGEALRSEKVKVLEAVRSYRHEDCLAQVVRGQYTAGTVDGRSVPGYRDESKVEPTSTTETYVAMKVLIDSWRWSGVPFYLRTGKRLDAKRTEVAIQFKQAPLPLFRDAAGRDSLIRNFLTLRLQPNESVSWRFGVKVPGQGMHIDPATMEFRYADQFELPEHTGYETLIHDCMRGEQALFQRADFVEAGWRVVQPVLDAWADAPSVPEFYAAGSQGPGASDQLLAGEGRLWCPVC